jgi:molybdopterin synthase catalytic subunit
MNFRISPDPIDPLALQQALRCGRAGACVTFEGWVRDLNEGRPVQALEYEAYVPLAEKEGARILAEAREKFSILALGCVHRVGALSLGDLAVWVGVAAEHRGEAFDACRYIIDQAKSRVPIWKRERYADGSSVWIEQKQAGFGTKPG